MQKKGKSMILLWGPSNDKPLEYVRKEPDALNAPYFLLNQHDVLESEIKLVVSSSIEEAYIKVGKKIIDLKKIKAVYLRAYDSTKVDSVLQTKQNSEEFKHALYFDELMYTWLELTEAFIINKLEDMASNSSKPYQTELIRQTGMKIPKTLITTDTEELKKFHKRYKNIIYKSVSGIRSIVSKLDKKDYDRLENLKWCPTQFQEHINGIDYRVHVVGEKVFACKIQTDTDDYRYASRQGGSTQISSATLPEHIIKKTLEISKVLNLPVVGIDLRKNDKDQWYCFEANPSPGFSYYEAHTGMPIANAIAKLLMLKQ
jgi:glutathione synthase/RimK-type ligase-like ATP-grasp enzyme